METQVATNDLPLTVDLTGLPEVAVRFIHSYVQSIREQQGEQVNHKVWITPTFISDPNPTREESRRLLDHMASLSSGQSLPADFSRADIYDDHD